MTDKEVKRLTRSQLIEIIYQLQLKQDELTAENEKLSKALEDRRILLNKTGDLAQAVIEIHNVMQSAQDAATHYLEEMQARVNEAQEQLLKEAREEAEAIISKARQQAEEIAAQSKNETSDCETEVVLNNETLTTHQNMGENG